MHTCVYIHTCIYTFQSCLLTLEYKKTWQSFAQAHYGSAAAAAIAPILQLSLVGSSSGTGDSNGDHEYFITEVPEEEIETRASESRAVRSAKNRSDAAQIHEHVLNMLKRLAAMRTEVAVVKVCICVYMCVCVYVAMCAYSRTHPYMHTHTKTHIHV
jgi:hypothetical protein